MEGYSAARRYCVKQLLPVLRAGEECADLETIEEAVLEIVGEDAADEISRVFQEHTGNDDPVEGLKGVISSLNECEKSIAMELTQPTSDELENLELACQKLWTLDVNRLEAGAELVLNFQEANERSYDASNEALFEYVDGHAMSKPTFVKFYRLLDNFHAEAGVSEEMTEEEKQEVAEFLDDAMDSAPMQYIYKYLEESGKLPDDCSSEDDFKWFLNEMWFFFYSKEARWDSSGFEHVFCGDVRDEKVGGMHNWIQLLIQERKGELNYLGFIPSRGLDADEEPGSEYVMSLSFQWKGAIKPVGSSFFGTSPEFEMALYTMCFVCGEERNQVKLADRYNLDIVCYSFAGKVGTCYPHVHGLEDDE